MSRCPRLAVASRPIRRTALPGAALVAALVVALGVGAGCSDDTSAPAGPDGAVPDAVRADVVASPDLWAPDLPLPDVAAPRPDAYKNALPSLANLTLVVNLGDSIAEGYGVAKGAAYIDLLMRNDDAAHPAYKGKDLATLFPSAVLSDRARGGSTSDDLAAQVAKVAKSTTGDTLVIVSIGGNDIMYKISSLLDAPTMQALAQKVIGNVQKVLDHFGDTTRYPGKLTVALLNVYDFSDGMGYIPQTAATDANCGIFKSFTDFLSTELSDNIALYNSRIAAFARQQGALVVDIHAHFLGHGFHHDNPASKYYLPSDPTLWYRPECIHPNALGHNEIRKLLWWVLRGS